MRIINIFNYSVCSMGLSCLFPNCIFCFCFQIFRSKGSTRDKPKWVAALSMYQNCNEDLMSDHSCLAPWTSPEEARDAAVCPTCPACVDTYTYAYIYICATSILTHAHCAQFKARVLWAEELKPRVWSNGPPQSACWEPFWVRCMRNSE